LQIGPPSFGGTRSFDFGCDRLAPGLNRDAAQSFACLAKVASWFAPTMLDSGPSRMLACSKP
jgi:hypothetical protein